MKLDYPAIEDIQNNPEKEDVEMLNNHDKQSKCSSNSEKLLDHCSICIKSILKHKLRDEL